MMYARLRLEEFHGVIDAHAEHVADASTLEFHLQRFAIEAPAAAAVAQHSHVRQEVHFDPLHALTFASFAAATAGVEGKAAGVISPHARLGQIREQTSNRIPESNVGGRAGTRRL